MIEKREAPPNREASRRKPTKGWGPNSSSRETRHPPVLDRGVCAPLLFPLP